MIYRVVYMILHYTLKEPQPKATKPHIGLITVAKSLMKLALPTAEAVIIFSALSYILNSYKNIERK